MDALDLNLQVALWSRGEAAPLPQGFKSHWHGVASCVEGGKRAVVRADGSWSGREGSKLPVEHPGPRLVSLAFAEAAEFLLP